MTNLFHTLSLAALEPTMAIRVSAIMIGAALLAGLAQALGPNSARLRWNISALWRAFIVAVLSGLANAVPDLLQGGPIGTSLLYALAMASPTWGMLLWQAVFSPADAAKAAMPPLVVAKPPAADPPKSDPSNPIPPAAALLLLGLVAWGTTACRATFDEVRPKSALKGLSVAGVQLLTPGSPECLSLSRQEHTWTGLAIAGGILGTSGTVGALIDLGIRDKAKVEVYVMLAAGGLIDAAAAFAVQQAAGYGRDFVAAGCGGTPAP